MPTDPITAPDDARCKSCGYSLRSITAMRCPECGRDFDPANPGTMHFGQPAGLLGRFLLRKTSTVPLALCCISAIALLCISRVPTSKPQASWVELIYYFHPGGFRDRLVTVNDLVYVGAVGLLVLTLFYLLILTLGRWIAARHYHRAPERPVHLGRRAALLSIASIAAALAAAFAWPYRIAKIWVRSWAGQLKAAAANPNPNMFSTPMSPGPPMALSTSERDAVLRAAIMQLPTVTERTTALNLLMTNYETAALPILLSAIGVEKDPQLRAMEIGLLGLFRDPKYIPDLVSLLDDPDPLARAAAIDALSINYWPAFPIPNKLWGSIGQPGIVLATDPPIPVPKSGGNSWGVWPENSQPSGRAILPEDLLARWKKVAFHGPTTFDREAAGRAIFKWQKPHNFRVAEWGVWIAGSAGNFALSKSVLEEIPPFVHQTGDRVDSDQSYLSFPDEITKPIIHITADEPLVLDFAVLINGGRPWYVYPLPDDYTVTSGGGGTAFSKTYNDSLAKLPAPRCGYKWLSPPHDTACAAAGWGRMLVNGIGLRWQTLLVSPERLEWMQPPMVPDDEKFAWWSRLRQVPSSWVSSRGEAERFLYYDGPTTCPSKWIASIESEFLLFGYNQMSDRSGFGSLEFPPLLPGVEADQSEHGLYVHLDRADGLTGGMALIEDSSYGASHRIPLASLTSLRGLEVPAKLLQMLKDAGLTTEEASGLIDSWQPQFFKTVGRRFLRIMTPKEYSNICPIQIDPPPSELVRVGIVLNEFGE